MNIYRDKLDELRREFIATINALQAENEALRKDAERYRWLRSDTVDLEQFIKAAHAAFDGLVDEAMAKERRP